MCGKNHNYQLWPVAVAFEGRDGLNQRGNPCL